MKKSDMQEKFRQLLETRREALLRAVRKEDKPEALARYGDCLLYTSHDLYRIRRPGYGRPLRCHLRGRGRPGPGVSYHQRRVQPDHPPL